MPRLLPRLLKTLKISKPFEAETFGGPLIRKARRRRSLWKPVLELQQNGLSHSERTHSLLLDEDNVITSPWLYKRHKTMPPVMKLQPSHQCIASDLDKPRKMTSEERRWWSSPYLRMLSSPIRQCVASKRLLPSDFLIRLTVVTIPASRLSRGAATLVPDGIQHSRFTGRVRGVGHYVLCWKDVIDSMIERKFHSRLSLASNVSAHSLLVAQIGHLLRVRVLQELELLAARLRTALCNNVDHVVIRRLTRSEWVEMRSTGMIPWEGAVCVLVVPPLNRNLESKQRPIPNSSALPLDPMKEELPLSTKPRPPLPLLSALHPTREPKFEEPLPFLKYQHLPDSKVMLYNGLSLFPSREQRAALHKGLCKALNAEGKARSRMDKNGEMRNEKASHAFVIFSNEHTVTRADAVPLAVALWRVRMWEGGGWEDGPRWQELKQ